MRLRTLSLAIKYSVDVEPKSRDRNGVRARMSNSCITLTALFYVKKVNFLAKLVKAEEKAQGGNFESWTITLLHKVFKLQQKNLIFFSLKNIRVIIGRKFPCTL